MNELPQKTESTEMPTVKAMQTTFETEIEIPNLYVNAAQVSVSPEEVVVRLGLMNPESPDRAQGILRLFMTPAFAKRLSMALDITITKYEAAFGQIRQAQDMLTPEARKSLGMDEQ